MAEGSNYDYLFKVRTYRTAHPAQGLRNADNAQVVLIGDSGVGKS